MSLVLTRSSPVQSWPLVFSRRFFLECGAVTVFCAILWLSIFHHVLWRDEMQAWQIAVASNSPLDLFHRLRFEGHPGLWHILLWAVSRFTHDPRAMQLVQASVGAGYLLLLWARSPFQLHEKVLLSTSYYLLFEYGVISRSYGLGVLLLFAFLVTDGCRRPADPTPSRVRPVMPWLLLGLLANTSFYGALLALSLAGWTLMEAPGQWRRHRNGCMVFTSLLLFAAATIAPAPDTAKPFVGSADWSLFRAEKVGAFLPRALMPFDLSVDALWDRVATLWNEWFVITAPLLALGVYLVFRRRPKYLMPIAFVGGAASLISWGVYDNHSRHIGTLFLSFVAMAWMARHAGLIQAKVFAALLFLNALGGVQMIIASYERPFSQSAAVAEWFQSRKLENAFIAAWPDHYVSPVSGYLDRPLYYPDCECNGTYIEWTRERLERSTISIHDGGRSLDRRLDQAMRQRGVETGYLIYLDHEVLPRQPFPRLAEGADAAGTLVVTLVASFDGAPDTDENYSIFRLSRVPMTP